MAFRSLPESLWGGGLFDSSRLSYTFYLKNRAVKYFNDSTKKLDLLEMGCFNYNIK